jgi:LPS-assembly lipoprotein
MNARALFSLFALLSALSVSACGLSPVYGDHANGGANSSVSAALDSLYIDSIPDRSGQKLRNDLMDRFYQTGRKNMAEAVYRLHVSSIGESIYGLGIAKDATATRSQIRLTASFTLSRVNDPEGKPLISRSITAVSSFNTLASQYTTLVSEEDARDQTLRDLADQISAMLELYFTNPAAFTTPQEQAAQQVIKGSDRLRRDALDELQPESDLR